MQFELFSQIQKQTSYRLKIEQPSKHLAVQSEQWKLCEKLGKNVQSEQLRHHNDATDDVKFIVLDVSQFFQVFLLLILKR